VKDEKGQLAKEAHLTFAGNDWIKNKVFKADRSSEALQEDFLRFEPDIKRIISQVMGHVGRRSEPPETLREGPPARWGLP
jgi:hypothetical protein